MVNPKPQTVIVISICFWKINAFVPNHQELLAVGWLHFLASNTTQCLLRLSTAGGNFGGSFAKHSVLWLVGRWKWQHPWHVDDWIWLVHVKVYDCWPKNGHIVHIVNIHYWLGQERGSKVKILLILSGQFSVDNLKCFRPSILLNNYDINWISSLDSSTSCRSKLWVLTSSCHSKHQRSWSRCIDSSPGGSTRTPFSGWVLDEKHLSNSLVLDQSICQDLQYHHSFIHLSKLGNIVLLKILIILDQ